MNADERRRGIIEFIQTQDTAVSGTTLSKHFGVSRQIIVHDISVLKNSGYDILSTHSGYVLNESYPYERVFKLYHTSEQTEKELNTIVDFGGIVADVFVWHKVYGRVVAKLNISSRHQVQQFIEGVRTGKSSELMNITGGYHYHTVSAQSVDILDEIEQALIKENFIAPEI